MRADLHGLFNTFLCLPEFHVSVKIAEGQKAIRLRCPFCTFLQVLSVAWLKTTVDTDVVIIEQMYCPVCNMTVDPVDDL